MSSNENIQTDIVVIGGGGAGLAAAVAARENKADVILLEKLGSPGGNTARAESFFAAESPAQRRTLTFAPREVLFKMAMDYAHWRIDPRIVRAFINKSGDTVRWLEEKGLVIVWVSPFLPNQVIRTEHQAKGGGAEVVKLLLKVSENTGIRLYRKTPAKKIFTDSSGKVTGVLAENQEGHSFNISAKCVIVATGGFASNKALIKKYCSWYTEDLVYRGIPHDGDGLLMTTEIGAAGEGLGNLRIQGPRFEGLRGGFALQQPNTVWVNNKGERFIDEAAGLNHFESVNALIRQPRMRSYSIFDEQIKQNMIEQGPIKSRQGVLYSIKESDIANLSDDLNSESEKGTAKIADSLDEIAEWIGSPAEVLKDTIEEYNRYCDQGYDEIFAKERRYLVPLRTPPYYAMRGRASMMTTQGGIKINHRMEVINREGNPIPGLYAAGDDTGGWEPETYNVYLSGSGVGFALNSGRIAGENAALFVSKK